MIRRTDLLTYLLYFLLVLLVAGTHWLPGFALYEYTEPLLGTAFRAYGSLEASTRSAAGYFTARQRLLERLRALRRDNRRLRRLLYRARAARRGRAALREYLNLPPAPGGDLLPAQVLAVHLTGWERTLRLNRGRAGGVRPGQPVIGVSGDSWVLRGKVLTASERGSVVTLTSDPRFRVGVRLEGIPDRQFVARGWGGRGLRVDHFPEVLSVEVGARVYTANASSVAPAGLAVGVVRGPTPSHPDRVGRRMRIDPPPVARLSRPVWVVRTDE